MNLKIKTMKLLILLLLISLNCLGQKIIYNNWHSLASTISFRSPFDTTIEQYGDFTKHEWDSLVKNHLVDFYDPVHFKGIGSKENPWRLDLPQPKADTLILSSGLHTVPNLQPLSEDEIDSVFINGTNNVILMRRRSNASCFDSMWLYESSPDSFGASSYIQFDGYTTKPTSGVITIDTTVKPKKHKIFDDDLSDVQWASQSKTDTVKGWIKYWVGKSYVKDTNRIIAFSPTSTIGMRHEGDSDMYIFEIILPATAIYWQPDKWEFVCGVYFKDCPYDDRYGFLLGILVEGKPFDLKKKYEFIRDDEIVK